MYKMKSYGTPGTVLAFSNVNTESPFLNRIGEPLWAETTRLLVRFVLLALLLALLVFLIIRAATSPLVTQQSREPVTAVQVPGIEMTIVSCFSSLKIE